MTMGSVNCSEEFRGLPVRVRKVHCVKEKN